MKQGIVILLMVMGVFGIAFTSAYTSATGYMKTINHIKSTAYKGGN